MVDQDQSDNIPSVSVFITTSRNPTHFLRRVSKVLDFSIPNSLRMNRGSLNLREIYRYCWNRQIPLALILQGTGENDIAEIKAYKIGNDVKPIDTSIKLSDIIRQKKHDRETRIKVDSIQLQFSPSVHRSLKKRIVQVLSPLLSSRNTKASKNFLSLRFQVITSNELISEAVQVTTRGILPLFKISVNGCPKYD